MDRAEAITMLNVIATQLVGELAAEKDDKRAEYAMRMINAVDMAIAALREQEPKGVEIDTVKNEWVSVKDRLPETRSWVLCYLRGIPYGGKIQVCRFRDADNYVDHPYFDHYRNGFPPVSHWMPLPEPPKEGAEHE